MTSATQKIITTTAITLLSTQAFANEGAFDVNAPIGLAVIGLLVFALSPKRQKPKDPNK